MEAKKTKQQQQKQKNKSSWSLGVEAHLHLLAFFSPCSNSRQLQASTDDSYISIVLHFYLTLSFFHFCQLLLRNWRRVWCRLTVVGLGLYDFVPFFFPFFFLPPDFPPDSSMPHYQVKSGGAADICRVPRLQAETHRHTEDSFRKPGRFSNGMLSTGSQNRVRRWAEEKSLLAKCLWVVYGSEGRKGNRDVVMHLSDTPLSSRPDCNLMGPVVVARYCFSFHMSQTIKTRLSIPVPHELHLPMKQKKKKRKYTFEKRRKKKTASMISFLTCIHIPKLNSQRLPRISLTFIVFISLRQQI